MSGHTPGQWTFRSFEPDGPLDDMVISLGPGAGDGDIVCLSPAMEGLQESAERWEANARLIAAAPDLLDALIAARDGANFPFSKPSLWEQVNAAIAKATGEAK